ncbi:hypothetical protein SAMN06295967_10846 [Belliella buryatensis]|uniref:Uncharacterized protein n=1 Tax=Belliella buryatensis TaxID=1500549 RepID=A0A239DVS3_9BACT|nr:hypothetical protein SAMN06295967_10846 [Belliella buryatensis]
MLKNLLAIHFIYNKIPIILKIHFLNFLAVKLKQNAENTNS